MAIKVMYCILTITADLKKYKRGAGRLYETVGRAKNAARSEGDAVVEVHIDLERNPLHIKTKRL